MKKKLIALALACLMAVFAFTPAFAESAEPESGTFKIVNYNVDGLPVPAFLSKTGRDPLACTKRIAKELNQLDADMIAVQEDFNFHTTLRTGLDAKYGTIHTGGIPFGDGLSVFSKTPMYNVERVPWETAYGIFTDGSDELTPKGFIVVSVEIADGVYIDVYNMHADAYGLTPNAEARVAEYKQMIAFIEEHSAGHAVLVTGDTNTRFMHTESELKKQFIDEAGFKEAWVELCNDGVYDITHDDDAKWGTEGEGYWGVWDSVEKLFYRDGGGVSWQANSHEFILLQNDEGQALSDHSAEVVLMDYTIDRAAVQDTRTYKKEHIRPFTYIIDHVRYFFKALGLVLSELPKLISGEIKVSFDK